MKAKTFIVHDDLLSKKDAKRFFRFTQNRIKFMSLNAIVDVWNKFANAPEQILMIEPKPKSK